MANTHSIDFESDSSQYAWAPDSASTSITGDITVKGWVKFETEPSGTVALLAKWDDDAKNKRSYFFGFQTDKLFVSISDDGAAAGDEISVAWTPSTGVWYHVAYTYKASTSKYNFYVNGAQQGTEQSGVETSIYNGDTKLSIACKNADSTPTFFLDGKVDDLRILNVVQTSAQIAADYKQEITDLTNMAAYYKFNNSALDETTNNNDLTLVASPTYSTDIPFADSAGFLTNFI